MPFPDQTASTLAAPSPRSAPLDPSGFDVGQFRDMADSLGNLTFAPQSPDATSNDVPRFQAPADNLYTIDPRQFTGLADTIQKQYGISNDNVVQHLADSGFTPEQIDEMPQEHFDTHREKLAEYGPSSTRKLQELFNEQKQSLPAVAKPLPISGARDADAAELEQLRAEVNQRIERNGTLYDPKFAGKFGRIEQLKTRMKSKYPALTKTPAFKAFDAETNKWFVKTQQRQQKVDQNEIKTLQEQNPRLLAGNEFGGAMQGVSAGAAQLVSPAMRFIGQGELADDILNAAKRRDAAQRDNVKGQGYGYFRRELNEGLPGAAASLSQGLLLGQFGYLAKTAKGAKILGSAMIAAGLGITTANDAYSEAIQAGLSTKEARRYSLWQGGTEAVIMGIFGVLGSKIKGLEGVQRLLLPAGKELGKQTGKQTLWLMAKGLIGETLEENTTTFLQQLNTAATLPGAEDSANWTDPTKEGFASVWESPMMQAIRQTTAQTVLMMWMAGTASGAAKLLRSRAKTFAADPSARNYEKAVEAGLPPNETPPNRAERADMASALNHLIDGLKHPYSAQEDESQVPGVDQSAVDANNAATAAKSPNAGEVEDGVPLGLQTLVNGFAESSDEQLLRDRERWRTGKTNISVGGKSLQSDAIRLIDAELMRRQQQVSSEMARFVPNEAIQNSATKPGEEVIPPSATEGEAVKAIPPSGPVVPNLTSESAITPSGETPNATQNQEAQQVPRMRQNEVSLQVQGVNQNDNAGAVENVSDPELTAPAASSVVTHTTEPDAEWYRQANRRADEVAAAPLIESHINSGKSLGITTSGPSYGTGQGGLLRAGYGITQSTQVTIELTPEEKKAFIGNQHDQKLSDSREETTALRKAAEQLLIPATRRAIAKLKKEGMGEYANKPKASSSASRPQKPAEARVPPASSPPTPAQPAVATSGTVASPAQESPPASGEASAVSSVELQFNDLLASGKSMDEALRIIAAGSKQPETPTVAEKIDEPRSGGAKPSILDRMKQKTEKANVEAIPAKVGKAKASGVDSKAKATQLESVPQADATKVGASKPELQSSEAEGRRKRSDEQAQRIASLPNEIDRVEATGLLSAIQTGHDNLDTPVSANESPETQASRKNIAKFLKEAEARLEELLSDEGPVETKGQKTARSKATAEKKKVVRRKITSTAEQKAELKALIDELPADQLLKDLSRGARAGASSAKGYLTDEQADDAGQEAVARAMEIANEFLEQSPRKPLTPWLVGLAKTAGMHKVSESSRNPELQAEEGSLENVPVRGTSRNASIDASSASNPAPTNVNTSGAATPINRPTPVTQPSPATQQVIARRIPMPELVEMVTHLIGHVPMVGHRLRKALGVAKLSEGTMDAEILLRPDIAKDPKQLARTLAHEIGHLIDWFPNFTMKRGNILGRIGVLRNYLKSMLDALPTNPSRALTPQARRVIRMAAEQSAGPRPAVTDTAATQAWRDAVADEYQRIIQDYVTRNDMLTKEAMKEELIGLSEWWKPYDHNAVNPSYVQYRESSRELYADALSVLLSAPSEVAQRAPTFWRSWLGYLDQKPEVSEKIIELWDRLGGTPQEIAERRTERRKEGFVKGSEAYTSALQARIDAEKSTWLKAKSIVLQTLLDTHAPLNAIASDIGDTNAIHVIDELNQVNNDLYLFFKDTDDNIVKPMLDEGFTPEEIWDEIGEYLIDNRIIKEVSGTPKMDKHGNPIAGTEAKARWEIMNPHGFTRTESIEQMTEQVRRLGKHKFNVLRDRMKAWHRDILWPHIAEAGNVGVYSQDKVANDLAKNKDAYAAFAVVRYIDEHVSPMLKQQVGTFEDVGNPFHFTMLKFMSLIRLNQLNKAANIAIDDLLPSVNGVTKLDVAYGHTKPAGKPAPGNAWITRLVDGKVEWYEVPANVAAAFDSHDVGMISDIANALSGPMYSVFHPLYVSMSPAFVAANPFRDIYRTSKNLSAVYNSRQPPRGFWKSLFGWITDESSGIPDQARPTLARAAIEYAEAFFGPGWQHAKGNEVAEVRQMLQEKAWGISWHSLTEAQLKVIPMGMDINRNWSDKLMDSKEWYNKYNPLIAFFTAVRFVGQAEEAAGKISAYNMLADMGVTGKQRAYDVRKIASTPDWTQKGILTKFTNLVWMYSRIGFNALQTSAQLATNNYPGHKNTAAKWWFNSAKNIIIPTMIMKAIMMVDPDDEEYPEELRDLSRMLRRIPVYFRENYISVPFGERTNSEGVKETIFMSIPLNPEDAFLAKITGALFDAMHIVAGGKPRETRSIRQAAENVASGVADLAAPNLSPPINTGITWLDYLTGKTPKDRFRDTPVIPKRTPEGWESDKKMIQWTINQFGVVAQLAAPATNAMFGEEFSDRKMSTGEAIVDGALKASGAGRIFRHSGRGQDEADWVDFERESQQRKELRAAYVPPAINRINSELSRLRGIPAAELSPTQMQRREQLSIFDSAVVQPLSEDAAKKSPEQLSALKAKLNSATAIAGSLSNPNNPLKMTSPPPEIAPLVNDFKYRLVMAATGQVSTEDKIKNKTVVKGNDGKTHTEWLKQWEKEGGDKRDPNIIAARELLKEIAPTADERSVLFRKAYHGKHGHFPSDMSPVRRLNDYYNKPAK